MFYLYWMILTISYITLMRYAFLNNNKNIIIEKDKQSHKKYAISKSFILAMFKMFSIITITIIIWSLRYFGFGSKTFWQGHNLSQHIPIWFILIITVLAAMWMTFFSVLNKDDNAVLLQKKNSQHSIVIFSV